MSQFVADILQSAGTKISVKLDLDRPAFAGNCLVGQIGSIECNRRQSAGGAKDMGAGIGDESVEIRGPYYVRGSAGRP